MKVACYCRVSTAKEEQLDSMSKQEEFFEHFAIQKGYELHKIYADEGISGKQLKNRVQFLKMIDDAKLRKFDSILVKDVSRFSRNTVDFLVMIRELKDLGINIYFISQGMNVQECNEAYLTILAALAQDESERLSYRVKFGKNITAKKGRVPNFVFGYDRVDNYTLIPNEEEKEIVEKIFDLYVNDGFGAARIAEYLNKANVRTKKNKQVGWTQKTVTDILRNEIYIGKVVNKKSEVTNFITGKRKKFNNKDRIIIDKPEFRIVSDEVFRKTQQILESRKDAFKMDKKRESIKYPLSNLIKCSECGYSFRRCQRQYVDGGKIYKWWTCSFRNAKGKDICINEIRADEEDLHEAIILFLKQLISNKKKAVRVITKEIQALIDDNNKRVNQDKPDIEKELKEYIRQKEKYMDMYKNEVISIDELKQYTESINERIKRLKLALDTQSNQPSITINIEKAVDDYFGRVQNVISSEVLDNVLLKQIIDRVVVYPNGEVKVYLKLDDKHNLTVDMPLEVIEIPLESESETVPECNINTQGRNRKA